MKEFAKRFAAVVLAALMAFPAAPFAGALQYGAGVGYGFKNGGLRVIAAGASTQPARVITVKSSIVGAIIQLPAIKGKSGFTIYRSEKKGERGVIIADGVKGKTYADVNVRPGKTYYYTVVENVALNASASGGSLAADTPPMSDDAPMGGASYESGATAAAMTDESSGGGATADNGAVSVTMQNDMLGGDTAGEVADEKSFILMAIDDPMMSVNGILSEIDPGAGTLPVLQNDRILVPIRSIIETMGGKASWDEADSKMTLDALNHNIIMWLNEKDIKVDGNASSMDVAAQSINGRTMLPLRFVAENIGCQIAWIADTKQIVIVFAK